MKINPCQGCKEPFQSTLAPCPDGREGCLVAHYDKNSFTCPSCGHDNTHFVTEAYKRGVTESIGVAVFNPRGLKKLELER